MKKCILLIFNILLFFAISAQNANLTVSSLEGTHVDTLLIQHLAGEGVILLNGMFNNQTGNVTYQQIGTFNANNSGFPFDSGLVITTGNVSVAAGPNNSASASSSIGNYYTESDLIPFSGGYSLTSCASLEFDFIASADTFTLNYIFASEEYCEYVNSSFNDAFAILLTGIDPVTLTPVTMNVAIIPGSVTENNPNGIPVSINNVNHGYHVGSSGPGTYPSNPTFFICNCSNTTGVQYDGYTTALSAGASIFGCSTYHMKIAVCNVGDNALDSGVFLEEGSLRSNSDVHVGQVWSTEEGGDTLMQNERSLDIYFTVERPFLTGNTDIHVETGGDAVLGQDYSLLVEHPSSGVLDALSFDNNVFFFMPGDTVMIMHVSILPDAQVQYPGQVKTAELYLTKQSCDGFSDLMEHFQQHDTITLHLQMSGVGIGDVEQDDLRLYPNPANHFVQVEMGRLADDARHLELIDVDGRVIRQVPVSGQNVWVDISNLPAGLYFVRTVAGNRQMSLPFVKQ
jgi:hypothetical protein